MEKETTTTIKGSWVPIGKNYAVNRILEVVQGEKGYTSDEISLFISDDNQIDTKAITISRAELIKAIWPKGIEALHLLYRFPKGCGHDFTCGCAQDKAFEAMAILDNRPK